MCETKLWEKNWVVVVNRGKSFQQNLLNKPVARDETFLHTFLVDHVKQFSVPTFCGSVWKPWRESPNCWRCPVLAWTRNSSNYLTWWKLYRVWISNWSELLRWFEIVFLALKLKFVKRRGYDTYEYKGNKKEHRDDSVVFTTETGTCDEEEEEEEEVARVNCVNNKMHSKFSNFEVYINNRQIYNSHGLYAHKSNISNNFKGVITEYNGVLHCEGYDYELAPEDFTNLLPDLFFTRRIELPSRPNGFMLYGNLGVDFFSTTDLFYPNMKTRLRMIRARPNFSMISDNPNVIVGIVDYSLYTRCFALMDDYHRKRMDMLAYVPVEYNYLETLAKTFIIPARQNQFIQENIFNNTPNRRVAIAMKTNSASTVSSTENEFWYQQVDLRQIRILRGGQPNVDFDTADNCRLYVTTIGQWTFRMIISQSPMRISKITMCWCLNWLQCKTLLNIVTILNLLENHWDWR